MRDKVDLIADGDRKTFEGCSLEIRFTDGSIEAHDIANFLGTPGNRVPDDTLAALFRQYATRLPAGRADAIVAAVWALDATPVRALTGLLRIDA